MDTHKLQVTFGLCLIGALPIMRGVLVFIAQMLGAMASAGVVKALFNGPLAVTTSLGGGTSLAQGVFIEMVSMPVQFRLCAGLTSSQFLTAQLVFTIIMLAVSLPPRLGPCIFPLQSTNQKS